MTKNEMIAMLAENTGVRQKDVRAVVDELFDPESGLIARTLKAGFPVAILGFGTFRSIRKKGRRNTMPDGRRIYTPEHKAVSFRMGSKLKGRLNSV